MLPASSDSGAQCVSQLVFEDFAVQEGHANKPGFTGPARISTAARVVLSPSRRCHGWPTIRPGKQPPVEERGSSDMAAWSWAVLEAAVGIEGGLKEWYREGRQRWLLKTPPVQM
jgi:hypothetical protein